ncbi:5328_t:CDS:2 [Acaulospora colombiana]|uniref:5328_t:CDS:1 n=1 Tax=Acaulospora colombiana TaxID=27376 RepID=A0ACA9KB04_9GLOM|nr:5328_t:CDS:2 [Acaulospora colombiana]
MTDQNEIVNEILDEVTTAESEGDRVGEGSARSGQASNTSVEVDLEFQNELRKVILGIQNDLNIGSEEKAQKIQDLMTSNWRRREEESRKSSIRSSSDHNGEPSDEELKPTYVSEQSQTLGCQHYPRGAKLRAECCKRWFTCRFCHDEECDHKIDRHETRHPKHDVHVLPNSSTN